jgi:ABC-type sugar transport system ATPase subunit
VASFIGSPSMNFITGRLNRKADGLTLEMAGRHLILPEDYLDNRPGLSHILEQPLDVGCAPNI